MSWQRGELWLDVDLHWFAERPAAVAVAGFGPAPISGSVPAPGLVASRRRRAELRRRRTTRRAWTAVLALSPVLLLPLAPPLGGGGDGAQLVAEDAPGPTATGVMATEGLPFTPVVRDGGTVGEGSSSRAESKQSPARAESAPKIEWHRATSVGLPYAGSLIGGTQLPVEGPDWITRNPVTESVPNVPWRLFGHETTIRAIVSVTAAYRAANPDAPRVVVGDVSRTGGGPMTDAHASHQNGLDVDVYYPRLDGTPRAPAAPDQVDRRLAQDLLDRFVAAGAQVVFVGYSTGLRGPAGVVVPYSNHENHMHVRFPGV